MDFLISDLHLQQKQPQVPRLFFHFMENIATTADTLYVLGDLFEYWVGDDFSDELTHAVITAFHQYAQNHGLFFIHGNRDFLLGTEFFCQTNGVFLPDPSVVTIGGIETLLMHGDSLCTLDKDYQNFRQMVRKESWQQAFLSQPLANRIKSAQELRDNSMQQQNQKANNIMDVATEEVLKVMQLHQVSRLIHGHTHRQKHHRLKIDGIAAERIVLGDWGENGNYCQCEDGKAELITFHLPD